MNLRLPVSRPFLTLVLVAGMGVSLASCGTLKKLKLPGFERRDAKSEKEKEKEAAATPPPRPVFMGTIAMVNRDGHFVLIDAGDSMAPAKGTALKSMSGGIATGVVTVGEVTRRPFAIADIVSGNPGKGDQVFQ